MRLPGPSRLVPLAALVVVHGASLVLAWGTLARDPAAAPAGYVPWVVAAGLAVGLVLVWTSPPIAVRVLALVVWALGLQLVLLPPAFSVPFRILAVAPVLVQTVLSLPPWGGPPLALAELGFFLAGQGSRTAWGQDFGGATEGSLWGLGALGLVWIGGAAALGSAFRHRDAVEAEILHLKEGVQQVVQANVGFQELAVAIEDSSRRRERLRITREIHDIVGYTLTNQTMVLQAAAVLLDRDHEKLRDLLSSAEASARAGLQEVRQALGRLRTGVEAPVAFLNRLHQLCRTFEKATGVAVELSGAQTPNDLPGALEMVLYRMVQEGLTNAFLHGKASKVTVGLALDEGDLTVHLADNGTGADHVTEGIGLTGMRERMAAWGGTLGYRAGSDGFTLWARVPASALARTGLGGSDG